MPCHDSGKISAILVETNILQFDTIFSSFKQVSAGLHYLSLLQPFLWTPLFVVTSSKFQWNSVFYRYVKEVSIGLRYLSLLQRSFCAIPLSVATSTKFLWDCVICRYFSFSIGTIIDPRLSEVSCLLPVVDVLRVFSFSITHLSRSIHTSYNINVQFLQQYVC